jgi:trk system potassium uptake protein TrkH
LYNNSFEDFTAHFWMNAVLAVLSFLGAVGFIVLVDYWRWLTGKVQRITLTSKIIISMSVWMIAVATLLILFIEPSIRNRPAEEKLLAAFFQAMTAMTTVGFNTVPIGTLSKATLLVLMLLMFIGASPSGTGGGVKSTTVSALLGVMRSALRGEQKITFWKRPVPMARVLTAIAAIGFYAAMLLFGTFLLELTQSFAFEQNLFEAASALGTVGLSTGITASLTPLGKMIVTFLMLTGRLGPLTFGMALFFKSPGDEATSDSDLAV